MGYLMGIAHDYLIAIHIKGSNCSWIILDFVNDLLNKEGAQNKIGHLLMLFENL